MSAILEFMAQRYKTELPFNSCYAYVFTKLRSIQTYAVQQIQNIKKPDNYS